MSGSLANGVPLLSVEHLSIEFRSRAGTVRAVEDVSLTLGKGESLGIVGESGSGKSVTAYTVMGILDAAGRVAGGRIAFGGLDMLAASPAVLADTRGREIAMIFQNPRSALNPIRKIGRQIEDVLIRHGAATRHDARAKAIAALDSVRIRDPEARWHAYPFQLSGGMCQRVMIAIALACRPALLIADEPTTGLDVTTQAAVMDLIRERTRAEGMALILITHDLALAGEYCDRLTVMKAGRVVETGPAAAILERPSAPYTRRLVAATPSRAASIADLEPLDLAEPAR